MSGFGFETFQLVDENRDAFEACREVAAAQSPGGALTVLLGPERSGKSHLLWSIAKQVRSGSARVGLALIMAREFPQKVRDLVREPKAISGGRQAMLLVDQLEQFREDVSDLEAVVRLFLEHGQVVVVTTSVHPARLSQFSEDFRRLLTGSRVLEIGCLPRPDIAAVAQEGGVAAPLHAELGALREARDSLENRLAREADAGRLAGESMVGLEAEVATLREARAVLEKKLADAVGLASEVAALNGKLAAAEAEVTVVRNRLKQSEAEAEGAFAEQARLQGQLSARRHAEEELADEREAHRDTEDGLRTLRNAVAELLAWSDVEAAGQDPVVALPALLQELEARRLLLVRHTVFEENARQRDDALGTAEALAREVEEARRTHAAAVAEFEATAARQMEVAHAALEEQERLERTLGDRESSLATTEHELEKARRQISLTTAEMDALRREAAAQVASANIQAGELQHRLTTLEAVLSLHHGTGQEVANVLGREAEGLTRAASVLTGLAGRLGHLPDVPGAPPEADVPETVQPTLFGEEAFVSLPPSSVTELTEIAEAMSAMDPPTDPEEGPPEPHE